MATIPTTEAKIFARRSSPLVGWGLLIGGAFFLAGGPMHPKEDPPGVSVKEHFRIMFENPAWYPSHAVLLVGMVLIAASLVALARGRSLADAPRAHGMTVIAAFATALAAAGMLLHLISASDADAIAAQQSTPLTDVQVIVETITVSAFGFSLAVLAVIGAMTRTLGNPATAVLGVIGGVGYGLAGATFLFTDRLDFLFPTASAIALWAIAAGIGLLLRQRAASPAVAAA
ncbi:MAG: hypothetical protein AVDCRST_MAG53-3348 [uncultured Solirubrobacteraceae bacterium]|uniref:DUF4386 family protein n=1 Tax=uncultured Solirubrobacteraceae bacterium TaxID=1162706 RepID=A0A6J4TC81_9ACTN|nr:MAG: hypothetical protein AVDCRST_MAG53-3348 [uncultured Solirubrobacteraceae bacterium]